MDWGTRADLGLKIFGFVTIILDGLLERLEGIDGLLEDLDHRDATDILGACLGHTVLGRLVFRHQLGVVAAHHGEHGHNGDHRSQQAGRAILQSKMNIITSMAMNNVMVPTMSARLWASRVSVSAAAASSRRG